MEIKMETERDFIDPSTQEEIIKQLSEKLKSCYIFPDVAEKICLHLQERLQDGEYAGICEGNLFALALTMSLQEVNQDEHLWVKWHGEELPTDNEPLHLNTAWQEKQRQQAMLDNYGIHKLERYPGNVGYIGLHKLYRPEWAGEHITSAMNFLCQANALIIDLRKCTGGYPGMLALICSYLFREEPVLLTSIYWRDEDITQQYWTLPHVPGKRFIDNPVYILTSRETFSAGEMLAIILQSHKRATIIGEATDGGMNPGSSYRIHAHFEAFIPIGRSIDPATGTSYVNGGVIPDISVPHRQSFNIAYKLALVAILKGLDRPGNDSEGKFKVEVLMALEDMENPD